MSGPDLAHQASKTRLQRMKQVREQGQLVPPSARPTPCPALTYQITIGALPAHYPYAPTSYLTRHSPSLRPPTSYLGTKYRMCYAVAGAAARAGGT
eukprot:224529-Rhodomonas_salina.1